MSAPELIPPLSFRSWNILCDRALVVVWDLENDRAMRGQIEFRVRRLIRELRKEGKL